MKNVVIVFAALVALVGTSALATTLKCDKVEKKNDGCFIEDIKKLTVTMTGEKIVLNGKDLKDVEGAFEKNNEKTGDDQYEVTALTDFLDQSDLGKVFVSSTGQKVVLSLRFTNDDGARSFYSCTFKCKK